MDTTRATGQDIRPLRIVVLNLMPLKITTETDLVRLLSNTPLQVEVTLLQTASYKATHTPEEHLKAFYMTFDEAYKEGRKFDGMIFTGAPVEQMRFEDVAYWDEIVRIMDWAQHNVFSSLYICWGAIAAAYYFYGVDKVSLGKKISGVYLHRSMKRSNPLVRNFDEYFYAPHSRHTEVDQKKLREVSDLDILAESDEAGIYLAASKDRRRVLVFGHGEYDKYTLDSEYKRDTALGRTDVEKPVNYYGDDGQPRLIWRAHSSLLMSNWLNYYVYQETPYDINAIK